MCAGYSHERAGLRHEPSLWIQPTSVQCKAGWKKISDADRTLYNAEDVTLMGSLSAACTVLV